MSTTAPTPLSGFCVFNGSYVADRASVTKSFQIFESFAGSGLFVFFAFYAYFSIKDMISPSKKPSGSTGAQVAYMCGLFFKALGFIISAILRGRPGDWSLSSLMSVGLSGYVTAIAYCFIFFSWTQVCAEYVGQDFAQFYRTSKYGLYSLIFVIALSFTITTVFMNIYNGNVSAHIVEASFAAFRDVVIAIAFIIYLTKIMRLSERPYFSCDKPESRLFIMCIFLILTLFLRAGSILMYTFYWADWRGGKSQPDECSMRYFWVYLFEQTIYEISPLVFIGYTRLQQIIDASYSALNANANAYSFTD